MTRSKFHATFRHLGAAAAKEQILRAREEYTRLRDMLVARLEAEGADRNKIAGIPQLSDLFRFPYVACKTESLAVLAKLDRPASSTPVPFHPQKDE